ncbi:UDP-GalNAc:beta-1,3-N-acetylgalactosaminyltransferase 1-like [Mercenaria mercenaria]|uniref:UDP-GalNAc:beta-1, 3-N-acetylgalactosaminyltransferase 1-like n=1 Tax=Mercenaria mercenaria TaxID=6596 RepID=UPI00234F8BD3|nr:UDP-GalNAc:beta-1,3-N-acetylgalactosaminyltransferase 1-like [Mercenaria mercenaria]
MRVRQNSKIIRFCVLCTFFIHVVIMIIVSNECQWMDEGYREKYLHSVMTSDSSHKINQITVNSEVLHSTNSTTQTSRLNPDEIFNVDMKPNLMYLLNPSDPKFALTVNGSYLLDNKYLCSSVSSLTILIMVLSAPNNFDRRKAIRETWANGSFYSTYGTARVLFLLGVINDSEVQRNIEKEFSLYGDILQGSFIDSYHNLSHKSVMGYKWVTERCRNAKYVIKTDDDIVINVFRVLEYDIHTLSIDLYHVHCIRKVFSPIHRDKGSKVYVEPNQFKGRIFYPPYCHGQYVMMLNVIVPYFYKSASQTPLFWIDDVFSYGIVMNNIPALKYRAIKLEEYDAPSTDKIFHCWTQKKPKWHYIFHVIQVANQIGDIWSSISRHYV